MSDIQFIDGLIVKAPRPGAPDFVKASVSIRREELITWLQAQSGDWVNAQVKESKKGAWYCAVDDWKPDGAKGDKPAKKEAPKQAAMADDDIPF